MSSWNGRSLTRQITVTVTTSVLVFAGVAAGASNASASDPCANISIKVVGSGYPAWTPQLKNRVLNCAAFAKKNGHNVIVRTASTPAPENLDAAHRVRLFINKNIKVKVLDIAAPSDFPQDRNILYVYAY